MVRLFFLFFFLVNYLFTNELEDRVRLYIGDVVYKINSNFIKKLFNNKDKFILNDGTLDSLSILKVLKNNGLLDMRLKNPQDIDITISTKSSPIFLTYSMNNILNSLGYIYFYISNSNKKLQDINITYTLRSEFNIDPVILSNEFLKRGYEIKNITKTNNVKWNYKINLVNSKILNSITISQNQSIKTINVTGKYWIMCECGNGGILHISTENKNWRPKISLFDKNMNMINVIESDEVFSNYKLQLSSDTKFLLITDNYNPVNLRNGIDIEFIKIK